METEFTPGPWIARKGIRIDVIRDHDSAFGICDLGSETELRDADYPTDEAIANAHLIAAAPELLEVCQKLLKNGFRREDQKLAEAAIAKALGKETTNV